VSAVGEKAAEEKPVLSFGTYAIALHFALESSLPYLYDIDFASFERDMLSYSYRREPPFWSRVVKKESLKKESLDTVDLRFPARIRYEAEGKHRDLICPVSPDGYRRRALDVKASRTDFTSGVSVLHLVLESADSEAAWLNEYDIVKITKLWELGEGVDDLWDGDLHEAIAVERGGDEPPMSVKAFAENVFEVKLDRPRVGTIQLLIGPEEQEREKWEYIWESISARKLGPPRHELVAVGGIVQGLLDFERINADELSDVFSSLDVDDKGLFGIHKGTLVSIAMADRVHGQAAPTIGISPYLLISQAVLLHNELQLDTAKKARDEAQNAQEQAGQKTDNKVAELRRWCQRFGLARTLAEAERAMHRALNVEYLPNVFEYEGERKPHEAGVESRALALRHEDLRRSLGDVNAGWQHEIEWRREFATDVMNVVLVIITAIGLHSVFDGVPFWIFLIGILPAAAIYIWLRRM
jgi:hypothetical protein